jgi:hypothetical protein
MDAMRINQALTWHFEEALHSFTLSALLRRGWPGFADLALLPRQLELGRAAAARARDFFGRDADFIYYGGLPLGSLGEAWRRNGCPGAAHDREVDRRPDRLGGAIFRLRSSRTWSVVLNAIRLESR